MGRLDPVSRVVSLDRKQARDLVFAHPGGSAHPSGPDGHGVSECELVGCHTLLLGRALLRAARAPDCRLFLSFSAKERRCAACPKCTGRPRARRAEWRRAHLGRRPGGTYHRRLTRQVVAERKGILWLKVPPSTVCKQERLAHGDDLIR